MSSISRHYASSIRLIKDGTATATFAIALTFHQAAFAQTTTVDQAVPQPVKTADSGPTAGIQDIVVTARKRSENLRDVPVAISSVSGDTLKSMNVVRITDLTTLVPNFALSNAALQPLSFIRGFGSINNTSFEQSVGKFVDNVSFGRDFDGRLPLFDLDRVEVLRGPQVLLYGNSATAGAMNITTKKPGDHFEADISGGYEFVNNEVLIQGGITQPLASWASLRVAGMYEDLSRGWIYNVGNGRHEPTIRNWAVRPTLRLEPSADLHIMLKAEINRLRDRGSTAQQITQSSLPIRRVPDAVLDDRRNTNYEGAPFFQKEYGIMHSSLYQGDLRYDLPGATLTSTTAYRRAHFGGAQGNGATPPVLFPILDQHYRQFSEELRLNGKIGSLEYLVGAYYQSDTVHLFSIQNFNLAPYGLPFPPFARFFTWDQRGKSYSAFADFTYHFTDELSLEAGGRYSIIRKSADQASNPGNFTPSITFNTPRAAGVINTGLTAAYTAVTGGIPHTFFNIPTREEHFQPQVVLQYKFLPRNQMFLKFVKGDKVGGVDSGYNGSVVRGANTTDAQFAPERARSFEAGVKGITSDNKFEYALTAYSTTITDLQAGLFLGTSLFTTNVGKARSQGVELELTYVPAYGLTLTSNAAYQDAKYLSYPHAPCTVGQSLQTPPCVAPAGQDLSGAPLLFSSKYSGNIGVTYETTAGSYRLLGAASVNYRSRYNTTATNDPLGDQKGVATIDAHIDVGPEAGWWTASFFGRNLTNYRYREFGVATPLVPGAFNALVSRGRQLGVRFSAKFD